MCLSIALHGSLFFLWTVYSYIQLLVASVFIKISVSVIDSASVRA